jgi:hypothetical protein
VLVNGGGSVVCGVSGVCGVCGVVCDAIEGVISGIVTGESPARSSGYAFSSASHRRLTALPRRPENLDA